MPQKVWPTFVKGDSDAGFFLAFLRLVSLEEIILILMKFKMFNAFLNFVNLFIINYVH